MLNCVACPSHLHPLAAHQVECPSWAHPWVVVVVVELVVVLWECLQACRQELQVDPLGMALLLQEQGVDSAALLHPLLLAHHRHHLGGQVVHVFLCR